MQEHKYEELAERSSRSLSDELIAQAKTMSALEARRHINEQIAAMKAEGKAYELSDEEEQMILAFRRFKLRIRHHGEVFKWQTRKPEGVQIVEDTAEIIHPQEVK
jgi:hypothetical protein